MGEPVAQGPQTQRATFVHAARTVFWSFFGVRKRADHESQTAHLNPLHVIVMGLIGAALFIAVLISIIKFVVLR